MLDTGLAERIIGFGRPLKYLLGVSDQLCSYMLSSLDTTLPEIFMLLISAKVVLRTRAKPQSNQSAIINTDLKNAGAALPTQESMTLEQEVIEALETRP